MAVLVHAVFDHGDKQKEVRGTMAAIGGGYGKGAYGPLAAPPAWAPPAVGAAPMMPPGVWPAPGVDFGGLREQPLAASVIALPLQCMRLQEAVVMAWSFVAEFLVVCAHEAPFRFRGAQPGGAAPPILGSADGGAAGYTETLESGGR